MKNNENVSGDRLGGLVEFLNYVAVVNDKEGTVTAYSPSYPDITATHKDEFTAISMVKDVLAGKPLE